MRAINDGSFMNRDRLYWCACRAVLDQFNVAMISARGSEVSGWAIYIAERLKRGNHAYEWKVMVSCEVSMNAPSCIDPVIYIVLLKPGYSLEPRHRDRELQGPFFTPYSLYPPVGPPVVAPVNIGAVPPHGPAASGGRSMPSR